MEVVLQLCVGFLAMPLTRTAYFCPITGCELDVSNLQNDYDYHGREFCVSESKRHKKRPHHVISQQKTLKEMR